MPAVTIKTRLALLFTAIVAVILGVFTVGAYSYAKLQRAEEFHGELLTDAIASAAIVLRSDNLSSSTLRPFQQQMQKTSPSECVTIFNSKGQTVFHVGERILRLSEREQQEAMKLGRYVVTSRDTGIGMLSEYEHQQAIKNGKLTTNTGDTQTVIFPFLDENGTSKAGVTIDSQTSGIPITGSVEYIVAVSSVDRRGLEALAELRNWFIGGYLISLLVVFFTGIYFAATAMSPISEIRRKAERISTTDLHVRIDEGARGDELSQLAHAFNGMLDRIEAGFKSQKQFVSNASHELRTPLTTIAGQLDVALMHSRSEQEYTEVISCALESTRDLNRLLNNLLMLAQTESDVNKPIRIDDVLFSGLREVRRRYPARKVHIQLKVSPEEENRLYIHGNESLLKVAVINVVENALKFSKADSTVEISVVHESGFAVLNVRDQGIGISATDLPLIFQPFFRCNPSSDVPGNGIGLALVKAVMIRHGGDAIVESVEGKGTNARLNLPVFSLTAES